MKLTDVLIENSLQKSTISLNPFFDVNKNWKKNFRSIFTKKKESKNKIRIHEIDPPRYPCNCERYFQFHFTKIEGVNNGLLSKRTGAIHYRGNNRWREKQIQRFSTSLGRGCPGGIIGEINELRFKDDQKKASYCNKRFSTTNCFEITGGSIVARYGTPPPSSLRSVIPFVYMERGVSRSRRFIDENYERWPIMQRASRARPFFPSFLSSFPFREPRYHPPSPSQLWGVLEEVLVRGGYCLVNLRFTSGWPPSKQPRTTT